MNALENDFWYLEANGRNLGRMASSRIVAGLLSGEYNVMHRVSRDGESWKAICNETRFEFLLQEHMQAVTARSGGLSSQGLGPVAVPLAPDVTVTDLANLENVRDQISNQLNQAQKMQEISLQLRTIRQVLSEIKIHRRVVIQEKQEVVQVLHPDDQNFYVPDPSVQTTRKLASSKFYKKVFLFFLIFVLGFLGVSYVQDKKSEKDRLAQEQKAQEEMKDRLADSYENAIKGGESSRSNDTNDDINEATASRESALKQIGKINGLLGKKDSKQDSLGPMGPFSDRYVELHNLAIAHMDKNNFYKAESLLLEALVSPHADRGAAAVALFNVAWRLDQATANKPGTQKYFRLQKVRGLLTQVTARGTRYKREILIAKALAAHLLSDGVALDTAMKEFLSDLPNDFSTEVEDGINGRILSWNNLYLWCGQILEKDRTNDLKNAFYANCLVRGGMQARAFPYVDYALKLQPQNVSHKRLFDYVVAQNCRLNPKDQRCFKRETASDRSRSSGRTLKSNVSK